MKRSAFVVPCLLALACATPAMADTTIKVKLSDAGPETDFSQNLGLGMGANGDMSKAMAFLEVDTASVPAGKVTFEVTNASTELEHEMLVASIAGVDAKLPYDDAKNRLNEDSLAPLGEVTELAPGKTGALTLDLKPGQYAVFCNVTGHFMAGMWKVIEVK
jgi:uncharacterized cupredoxin-like copper-binding protein